MGESKKTSKATQQSEPSKTAVSEVPAFSGVIIETAWQIAIPFMTFVLGGNWLDVRFDSKPLYSLIGLFLALVSTFLVVRRIVNTYYPDTFKSDDQEKN